MCCHIAMLMNPWTAGGLCLLRRLLPWWLVQAALLRQRRSSTGAEVTHRAHGTTCFYSTADWPACMFYPSSKWCMHVCMHPTISNTCYCTVPMSLPLRPARDIWKIWNLHSIPDKTPEIHVTQPGVGSWLCIVHRVVHLPCRCL